jgi:hypothetical protein
LPTGRNGETQDPLQVAAVNEEMEAKMNKSNVHNGMVLASALVVLFSLMFATSVVVRSVPAGL